MLQKNKECIIIIQTQDDGSVGVTSVPSATDVASMIKSGNTQDLTPAHTYLMTCLRAIKELSNRAQNERIQNEQDNSVLHLPGRDF